MHFDMNASLQVQQEGERGLNPLEELRVFEEKSPKEVLAEGVHQVGHTDAGRRAELHEEAEEFLVVVGADGRVGPSEGNAEAVMIWSTMRRENRSSTISSNSVKTTPFTEILLVVEPVSRPPKKQRQPRAVRLTSLPLCSGKGDFDAFGHKPLRVRPEGCSLKGLSACPLRLPEAAS